MDDMKKLKFDKIKNLDLYMAGLPNFPKNFARDGIISAILMQNKKMLKDQLIFCAKTQGKKKNPRTGEEPGKIIHEYPGTETRKNLKTTYNACDTTALFIIGHEIYQKIAKDKDLINKNRDSLLKAIKYIKRHTKKGAFVEDPKYSKTNEYALKVTYWKDSEIVDRKNGEPIYPITYFLNHIQNMRAMKSAYRIFKKKDYLRKFNQMKSFLNSKLYDKNIEKFYIAIDRKGPIKAKNSDFLHSLFYLNPEDLSYKQVIKIIEDSRELETEKGYRTMSSKTKMDDAYHSETLWPFEQALINVGAKKFKIKKVEKISSRINDFLKTAPEIYVLDKKEFKRDGCDPQLWTVATKKYFKEIHGKGIFP